MNELRVFLFGVAVAAPLGPIALLLIHTGLNHRPRAALAGALGVALADFSYGVAALAIGSALAAALQGHEPLLRIGSSLLLLGLGLKLARDALRRPAPADPARAALAPGLLRLYLLTLTNPLTIVLFVGFAGQLRLALPFDPAARLVLYYASILFLGSLVVQVAYAASGVLLQRLVRSPGAIRALNALSGAGIATFGMYGLITAR